MDVSSITLRMLFEHPLDVPVLQWALFLVIMSFVVVMFYLQMKNDPLDLRWLILDNMRKPALVKIAQIIALAVSTWGFVVLVLKGQLTESYFLAYMAVWSGSAALDTYFNKGSRESRRRDDRSDFQYGSPDDTPRSNPYDDERGGPK